MTISMLKGSDGHQSRDMEDLVVWLKSQPSPDLICLSNALLLGMAEGLKAAFPVPLLCFLQGEDSFLDALPEPHKSDAWQLLTRISRTVDQFISPSHYFAGLMIRRLGLVPAKVAVVPNGIRLDGYPRVAAEPPAFDASTPPVIGYFARQCRDKGLDTLVEAFIRLNERGRVRGCHLKIGGSCAPTDKPFLDLLRHRLGERNLLGQVTFHPNIDRTAKIEFLRSLTLFSVPARYGESFGLYLVEALASGVPVVQPRTAAFTEFVEASGAGSLFQPEDPESLAIALETLLLDHQQRAVLRQNALRAAHGSYSSTIMASRMMEVFQALLSRRLS
jgi:glycosyltransferase involved in cell wall biosynthesis